MSNLYQSEVSRNWFLSGVGSDINSTEEACERAHGHQLLKATYLRYVRDVRPCRICPQTKLISQYNML